MRRIVAGILIAVAAAVGFAAITSVGTSSATAQSRPFSFD